jgi:mannose-6-phosphate isomerase-like protein (cupin superfamily)
MTVQVTRWEPGPMPFQLLADSEATAGQFLFGEARMDPGSPCPSLHIHTHEYESFYVVEGVLTVEVGDQRLELKGGDYVVLPPGVPHRFANLSDAPVRVIGAMAPTNIEKMFAEEEAFFASLDGPPYEADIAKITEPYGVTIVGPPLTA